MTDTTSTPTLALDTALSLIANGQADAQNGRHYRGKALNKAARKAYDLGWSKGGGTVPA